MSSACSAYRIHSSIGCVVCVVVYVNGIVSCMLIDKKAITPVQIWLNVNNHGYDAASGVVNEI